MAVLRGLCAAGLFAAASLWLASPAAADPAAGIYTYSEAGLPPVTWEFSPTCLPPDFCYLHVTSSTRAQITHAELTQNFGGTAMLVKGEWTMVVNKLDGMLCADGTTARTVDTYRFDQAQTGGTRTTAHTDICGLEPGTTTKPFTLQFREPLPYPVDNYPLFCEDIRFWCPN